MLDARDIEEISIGDYVLSGGELAAQVLIDACVRLLPGVAGNETSLAEESFASGLLEYPHYTRPREWEGRAIPEVLLSGDHKKIAEWRRAQAEKLTRERRPDLWQRPARTNLDRGQTATAPGCYQGWHQGGAGMKTSHGARGGGLLLSAPAATAQEADIEAGAAYAEQVCAACHAVLPNEEISPLPRPRPSNRWPTRRA